MSNKANKANKANATCDSNSYKMLRSAIKDLGVALDGTDSDVQKRFGLNKKKNVQQPQQQMGGFKVNCHELRMQLLAGSVLAMIFGMIICNIDGKQIFKDIEQKYFPGTEDCDEYSIKCRLSGNLQTIVGTLFQMLKSTLKLREATVFVANPWAWMKGYTNFWYLKISVDIGKLLLQSNFGLIPLCQIMFLDSSVPPKEKQIAVESFFTELFKKYPDLSVMEQELFHDSNVPNSFLNAPGTLSSPLLLPGFFAA